MQAIDFPPTLLIGGLIGGALGAAATAIFHLSIMPSVNATLPRKERVQVYATDWNLFFVLRRHKELFPTSKSRTLMYILGASAGVAIFGALFLTWALALLGNLKAHP